MIPFISKILRIPDRFVGPKIGIGRRVHAVMPLQPVGIKDVLALEIPARGMLVSPVLPEKSLTMLYAPRGIGKSWLGLSIGVAVASGGSLLKWQAPAPRRVLVADGEMPLVDLQARLNSILAGLGADVPNERLRILAADNNEVGINLGSIEGQQALEPSRWCGPFDFGQPLDAVPPITRPRKARSL
jgi:hypothetical protein